MIDDTYVRRIRLYPPTVGDAIELANPHMALCDSSNGPSWVSKFAVRIASKLGHN